MTTSNQTTTRTPEIVQRIMSLLELTTAEAIQPDRSDYGDGSIRRLGVSSSAMLEFLVAVEDEFGIEWDDELDDGILGSFGAMAEHIARELGL